MQNEQVEQHRRALAAAGEYVRRVTTEDLAASTPCAGWTLADLLGHMIGQHHGFAAAVRDGDAPRDVYASRPFTISEWDSTAHELLEAFAAADADCTAVLIELAAQPLPIARVISAQLLDTVVHTWDIAQSLGQPYDPPADVADVVARAAMAIPDGTRRTTDDAAFAPALHHTGTPWERALAHLGRVPATTERRVEQ